MVGGLWQYTAEQKAHDVDHLAALVLEVVPHNSCLVFCPTKKNCENVAQLVCRFMTTSVEFPHHVHMHTCLHHVLYY